MAAPRKPSAKARRSAARLAAVQALYQIATTGVPVETVIGEFVQHRFDSEIDGEPLVPPDPDLFARIVRGVSERGSDIAEMVSGALDESWSLDHSTAGTCHRNRLARPDLKESLDSLLPSVNTASVLPSNSLITSMPI